MRKPDFSNNLFLSNVLQARRKQLRVGPAKIGSYTKGSGGMLPGKF